jgi:hypothetical protein
MLKNQLMYWMGKIALGKELALALTLLRCVNEAVQQRQENDLARFALRQMPAAWRNSKGPVSEAEFVDLLQAGQLFLSKIQTVFKAI